jgi:putative transposase
MRHLLILLVHLITTVLRLVLPGGVRAVVAESVLAKHQLLIVNRSRRRAPNLRVLDRLIAGFCSLWIKPSRFFSVATLFKPSILLNFHRALVQRKYRLLFSPKQKTKPGPKGPTADLIRAVVEMKQRNPTWGCPHIADQINLAFGTRINKDIVRRILALHYGPVPTEGGPSWLTVIGHTKDSLWSLDLFRCESIALQTYWENDHVQLAKPERKEHLQLLRNMCVRRLFLRLREKCLQLRAAQLSVRLSQNSHASLTSTWSRPRCRARPRDINVKDSCGSSAIS